MSDEAKAGKPVRWFEDFTAGQVLEGGDFLMTEEEITGFARRYDPQPFHLDAEAAKASMFGELVASGWNTAAVAMRLMVEHFFGANASMGSPGIDELRWPRPVRVGDRLRLRATVEETRLSRSKPDRGLVHFRTGGAEPGRRRGDEPARHGLLPHPPLNGALQAPLRGPPPAPLSGPPQVPLSGPPQVPLRGNPPFPRGKEKV